MFWDITIAVSILATAVFMAYLGVDVTLHPPDTPKKIRNRKIAFWSLGIIAGALTVLQGVRNGLSQHELIEVIKNNKPIINVLPASPTIQVTSSPALPAPKSEYGPTGPPQIDARTFPQKASSVAYTTDKSVNPGTSVLITSRGEYRTPVFELKCSVPCTFYPAFSQFYGKHVSGTLLEQLRSPSPQVVRIRMTMPVKLEADEQVTLEFRSNDKQELSITDIHPYLGKDLTPQ